MEKFLGGFIVALIFVAIVLGIYWALWSLWCWVLPAIWVGGPAHILKPDFWIFAGAWFLMALIGRAIFGRSKE